MDRVVRKWKHKSVENYSLDKKTRNWIYYYENGQKESECALKII